MKPKPKIKNEKTSARPMERGRKPTRLKNGRGKITRNQTLKEVISQITLRH